MSIPAARLFDLTAHGDPLKPGPGSPNVLIGGKPAWRGISAAQAAQLIATFNQGVQDIAKAQAAATAAKGTPGAAAAETNLANTIKNAAQNMAKLMAGFNADKHICAVPYVVIPHGVGVVINGSQTVLINDLPACRQTDTIQETLSVNSIAVGEPTVLIGS
ncbi:MAG: PAAR domain-containing protein [Leptolyngbyaceae cyanobacterium bins.302]|nr:PAAR domain-containing protein [Leptolyngbyaceae cyanobacterium bins.302]